MSKTLAPRTHVSAHSLLARILDEPGLVGAVQALPPAALLLTRGRAAAVARPA